jgi:hypothetical protein
MADIPFWSVQRRGLYQVLCTTVLPTGSVCVPTGSSSYMMEGFEGGTGTVSGLGQGTTAGV